MQHIGNPALDAVMANDNRFHDMMAVGSLLLLNAIETARGGKKLPAKALPGSKLIWNDGSNSAPVQRQMSATMLRQRKAVETHLIEKDRVRSLAVKRDPCPHCGTRQDIGCKHLPRSVAGLTPDHINAVWDAAVSEGWASLPKADAA